MWTIIEVQVLMDREELFLKYMDQIYRMAFFMLSNTHDAEDAVQETYVRMLVKKPKFADEEHGKAWLLRVCINICKNQIRFWKRHPQYELEEIPIKIDSFKEWELLHEISRLRGKSKEVLILFAVEGYSIKEISAMLKISESAIKKRLQRGREELSRQLGVRQ